MADLGDLQTQFQDSLSRTLAPQAVLSQVGLMGAISLATVLAFCALRPNNRIVYEPKSKYHYANKEPPKMSKSFFGWLSPLIHVKEPEIVDKVGLDAATFLRFLRMMRWLFTCLAILGGAALIPGDAIYSLQHVKAKNRTELSILTIQDVFGNILYAHIGALYAYTVVVCAFTWMNWKAMARLRHDWFRSPDYAYHFFARTLQITGVPKKFQSDEGIKAIFESMQVPYPTTSVHIGRSVGALPELVEYHNNMVCELEKYLVRYLKGNKIGNKRPTIRMGGFMGMGGKTVDAIDYYTDRLRLAEEKVQAFRSRIDQRKPENYGFASMAAVPYAHVVADLLQNKKPKGATITLAPDPKDIIWSNMTISSGAAASKRTVGFVWLAFVAFMNTVPLALISFLANLSSFAGQIPFLEQWQENSHVTFSIISGVLPPAVSALFGWALPRIMRAVSKYQGGTTHSRLDRAVVARYFAFLVISQLIIFTVIGVVFKMILAVIHAVQKHQSILDIAITIKNLKVLDLIDSAYVQQSTYWLTFFPLRGFLVIFDLAQLLNLFLVSVKTRLFGRTPRDHREFTKPPEFEFSIYYSNMLFMACVGLVFAPLAPLVTAATAVVFWISSWVYKYQLMFVFVSRVETGGRLWNVVINRVLASAILMQALLLLTLGLKFGWMSFRWVACVPPMLVILIFKYMLTRSFDRQFRYYCPTEQELRDSKQFSTDVRKNMLGNRFGHPALHADLFTPMVHAGQVPLLSQVYAGKVSNMRMKMQEMGGQKVDAVVSGGIKFAAIQEDQLQFDAALYKRERGDANWDAKSVMTDFGPSKLGGYDGGRASPGPPPLPYQQQSAATSSGFLGATTPRDEYELSRFDSHHDELPLLGHQLQYSGMGADSRISLPPNPQYPGVVGGTDMGGGGYREAPLHRPYPPSRDPSGYATPPVYPPSREPSNYSPSAGYPPAQQDFNMAGRGAHRS